jgi:hypothetical protein
MKWQQRRLGYRPCHGQQAHLPPTGIWRDTILFSESTHGDNSKSEPSKRVDRFSRSAPPEVWFWSPSLSGWRNAIYHGRDNINIRENRPRRPS